MHERYEAAKPLIPPGRLVEVRYEDLVGDLVGGVKVVYDALRLGGFDAVRPKVEAYAARTEGYATNVYDLTPEQRAAVAARWGDLIAAQGYG